MFVHNLTWVLALPGDTAGQVRDKPSHPLIWGRGTSLSVEMRGWMNQEEADLSTLAGAVGLIHRYDYSGCISGNMGLAMHLYTYIPTYNPNCTPQGIGYGSESVYPKNGYWSITHLRRGASLGPCEIQFGRFGLGKWIGRNMFVIIIT